jgi:hypothetical protein
MKAQVSLLALAVAALSGCATAGAQPQPAPPSSLAAVDQPMAAAAPAPAAAAAPTAADADAFIANAEKQLGELSVISGRAQWVNATYITEDTDALATYFGTLDTELRVKLANEAALYAKAPGLSPDAQRKLNILRSGLALPAPTRAGAAAELNRLSTDLQSQYGKGRGTMNGQSLPGNEIEARMGSVRNPAQLQEMWTSWNDNVGAPMRDEYQQLVGIANEGAKELGYDDTGAMWRSKYDMTPAEFEATTERLWNEVKPLYEALHCFTRAGSTRNMATRCSRRPGRSVPTCSAICGRRNGAISTTWWRRAPIRARPMTSPSSSPAPSSRPRRSSHRRAILLVAGLRAAAGDLLEAFDDHAAARPRGSVPCVGLGRRQYRGSAHQDVHPGECRRFRHGAPRAGSQLLPARLQQAALSLSRQRQ